MARVLIDTERIRLEGSDEFTTRLKKAIQNKADFWAGSDGANFADTAENRLKWATNRRLGRQVKYENNVVNGSGFTADVIKASKGMSFEIPGTYDNQTMTITNPADEQSLEQLLAAVTPVKLDEMAELLFAFYSETDIMR